MLFPIKLKVFHPIKDAFSDFDYTDFYFSKLKHEPEVSEDIVIVNIGNLTRPEIAAELEIIRSGHPRHIGLDALFVEPKSPQEDSLLIDQIAQGNITGIFNLKNSESVTSAPQFSFSSKGYGNFYGDSTPTKVIRYFSPTNSVNEVKHDAFTTAIYKSVVGDQLKKKYLNEGKYRINYRAPESFICIQPEEIFGPDFNTSIFKDKIVLMGFAGVANQPLEIEDQHFTPMNVKLAGKSLPDMKGIFIHASILQSMLDGSLITNCPKWIEWLLTFVITYLISMLIIHYYVHRPKWFHLMAKIVQLFFGVVFLFISIWIMHVQNVVINFTFLFLAIVLCADLVYFYDPIAKWLHRKGLHHSEILKH